MTYPIINNVFSSPYYIFIKARQEDTDQIFERLELEHWNLEREFNFKEFDSVETRYFFTSWIDGWFHIIDDLNGTLCDDKKFRGRIQKLGTDFDIFTCSFGDVDASYDFIFFKNGKIVREYIVEDPDFNGGDIVKNYGLPLVGEVETFKIEDKEKRIIKLANNLGINTKHELKNIKAYWRKELASEKFIFNDDEY